MPKLRFCQQRRTHPVFQQDINAYDLSSQQCVDLLAAQRANRRKTTSTRGSAILQETPDHIIAAMYPSPEAFDEEHTTYLDDDSAAASNHAKKARSASSRAPHTDTYVEKLMRLEEHWDVNIRNEQLITGELHLDMQAESEHEVLESKARLERMQARYMLHTPHSCNGVSCSGHATIIGYREVEYRNLQHSFTFLLPQLLCPRCKRDFYLPASALR